MREIEKISEALFEKIRDRFTDVSLGDDMAQATQDPAKARFFNFDFTIDGKDYGNVTISIIDEMSLKVYFSKNLSKELDDQEKSKWYGFLRELREFAKRNMLSFEPRDITRGTLKIRDIQQVSKADSTYSSDEVIGESRMYGTMNRSYESFGPVRIKIAHSKPIVDEVNGARSRNISAVYVENSDMERFKLPFTNLTGARAMARHISAGGMLNDDIGREITKMVNEMTTLRPFLHSMRMRTFEDQEAQDMFESAHEYHALLKDTLKKIKGKKGYERFKEDFTPNLTEEEVDVDSVREKFVKKVFPDKLSEALPIVYRAHQKMKENKNTYAEQFESWAERISEGTWHIPETDEDVKGLAELLRKPIKCGVDGMDGTNAVGKYIGDDNLYDDIEELAKVDPEADCNSLVVFWLENNMPEVLEQIKELSPDGFVRDQGRQQEKPRDWAQAVAADESIEQDKEKNYRQPGFNNPRKYTDDLGIMGKKDKMKEGDCKKKETEFHRKLDKLVHDTFGKRAGELEEGKMKGLALDMIELSDEEFEKKYQTKKSDWEEVKNKDLRMDPDQPAYISKNLVKEEDNYPEYLGFQNDREYFKSEHEQYCMQCNHLSHIYAEHGENPDIEGEADVVCPNCGSSAYFIATDEEIKKYGPAKDELELPEGFNPMVPGDSSSPLTYAKKAYCDDHDDEELDEEDYSQYDEPTFKRKNPQPDPEKSGWAGYNMDEPAYKRKAQYEKEREQLKKLAGL